jgi:beta-lactamase regulating signal transducer with metallopeptidase domain
MTPGDLLLAALLRAEAAGAVAILLVLLLRRPARRLIGPELAYRLWAVVPAAAVAGIFPSLADVSHHTIGADLGFLPAAGLARPLLLAWLAGAALTAMIMALSEASFRRLARQGRAGPAVMGVLWPRMVTPADYAERFTAPERELIRQHERTHIARGDPGANLFIAVLRALSWFNPLAHLAAACVRLDQELACDATVIEARPESRRLYGETLFKAHLDTPRSPFACAWPAPSRHPLETRLALLTRPSVTLARYMRGAALVGLIALLTVLSVWGAGPGWSGPVYQYTTVTAV